MIFLFQVMWETSADGLMWLTSISLTPVKQWMRNCLKSKRLTPGQGCDSSHISRHSPNVHTAPSNVMGHAGDQSEGPRLRRDGRMWTRVTNDTNNVIHGNTAFLVGPLWNGWWSRLASNTVDRRITTIWYTWQFEFSSFNNTCLQKYPSTSKLKEELFSFLRKVQDLAKIESKTGWMEAFKEEEWPVPVVQQFSGPRFHSKPASHISINEGIIDTFWKGGEQSPGSRTRGCL